MRNIIRHLAFILVFTMVGSFSGEAFAQREVGIPFEKWEATLLKLEDPYETILFDTDENEFDSDYEIEAALDEDVVFKYGKDTPVDKASLLPGMTLLLTGNKFRSGYVVETVTLKTKIDDWRVTHEGAYESYDRATGIAIIDGQRVMLNEDAEIDGKAEWKKKKFTSFDDMMLGSTVKIQGVRGADGVVYVSGGTTSPNLYTDSEQAMSQAMGFGVKHLVNANGRDSVRIGLEKFELYDDPALQAYVDEIGNRLVPQWMKDVPADQPDKINFKFQVIKDPLFNASGYANGTVIVHTGLLKALTNEAQLAAVLGHEIAHISHEHGIERYERERRRKAWKDLVQRLGKATGTEVIPNMPEAFKVGKVSIDAGVVLQMGELALSNIFSRDQESQADRVGLIYMYQAGYDPREAAQVWKSLLGFSDPENKYLPEYIMNALETWEGRINSFIYSSHPETIARSRSINLSIATNFANRDLSNTGKGESAYQKVTKGLKN